MRDVTVNIKGTQKSGDDSDTIEYFSVGKYGFRDGHAVISYDESTSLGVSGVTTTLLVDDTSKVVLQRSGAIKSRIVIEKGKRNLCHYGMAFGSATIGVFGETMQNDLNINGGHLFLEYTIDLDSSLLSTNKLEITIEEV